MNAVDAGLVDAALVERVRMRLAAEPAGPGADSTASTDKSGRKLRWPVYH